MKKVIYFNHSDEHFYLTTLSNYKSYVVNPKLIKKLYDITTLEEVQTLIENACLMTSETEDNYIIVL